MMRYTEYHESLVSLPPRALYAYLSAHGWEKMEPYGDQADIFALNKDGPRVLVPASAAFSDYAVRLAQIIATLSEAEEREGLAILRDLSLTDFDLVRVGNVEKQAMAVDDGLAQIRESRNLLLAAACSATRPQPVFRAGRNAKAAEYLSTVQLDQTGQGGFHVNMLSPIPPNLSPVQRDLWGDLASPPFPQQVMSTLISGLRAANEAVVQVTRGGDIRDFEERVPLGISANLCDAIGSLLNHVNGDAVDISVQRSFVHHHSESFAQVRFVKADAPVLEEASRILKDRHERFDERIEGYVTALARGVSEPQGRATIRAIIDGTMSAIKVNFDPTDYSRITQAHDDRRPVSLEGDLKRDGRRWQLTNPRDLVVSDEDDDDNGE